MPLALPHSGAMKNFIWRANQRDVVIDDLHLIGFYLATATTFTTTTTTTASATRAIGLALRPRGLEACLEVGLPLYDFRCRLKARLGLRLRAREYPLVPVSEVGFMGGAPDPAK